MKYRHLILQIVLVLFASALFAGEKTILFFGETVILPTHGSATGTWYYAQPEIDGGSQLLLLGHDNTGVTNQSDWHIVAEIATGDSVRVQIPNSEAGTVTYKMNGQEVSEENTGTPVVLTLKNDSAQRLPFEIQEIALTGESGEKVLLSLDPVRRPQPQIAPETILDTLPNLPTETRDALLGSINEVVQCYPDLFPSLQNALVVWDWKMQDGIETPREPRTYQQAVDKRLPQVEQLVNDLAEEAEDGEIATETMNTFKEAFLALQTKAKNASTEEEFEQIWRDLHQLRREMVLAHPLFPRDPIVFAKHVPSAMSHQLTQPYGYCARSGGGLYLLENPGESNIAKKIETGLPPGNYMHPSLSYDGKKILFAYCATPFNPREWHDPETAERYYQIYSINTDGTDLRRLTNCQDDCFSPIFLPDGDIICSSSLRGGFHRCGGGPCPVYTITRLKGDGSEIHPLSYHETNEWNPTVANDGRIVYTRWDYVDRNAVFYQQLWSMRPDGTDVRIYYGNNTFSPCGTWESQAVPGSSKIMAIGSPHHGMSAGSVLLIDNSLGVDGSEPITRLTPEILFPEAETPLPHAPEVPNALDFDSPIETYWDANSSSFPADRLSVTEENLRWPVHCMKSPWPLSEHHFLASYSFDRLTGEIGPCLPNQFGLYWCDSNGTRELIYRDPNISSVWGTPTTEREAPPAYVSTLPKEERDADGKLKPGRFFLQNVYESWPWSIPAGTKIASLRVVQVLPKTTPNANQPMVGRANASPGKQILGTVPVEEDGSAFFEVPSKTPFLLQALDEKGRMVVGMRSLIYAQPGETQSCTGCHENRLAATSREQTIASRQEIPSQIKPGPDGSKPFSYPILVQSVWDKHCISCHNPEKKEGEIDLTGEVNGNYTQSYHSLNESWVYFTAWGRPNVNLEPMTKPFEHGTYVSPLIKLLDDGHYDVKLSDEDWERIHTWIDGGNALFYGTFNPDQQKIQVEGGRIDGPDLE